MRERTLVQPSCHEAAKPDIWRAMRGEWRKEWPAGMAAFVGTALCMSAWPAVSSLFIQPLQAEFGWTRGEVVFAYNASILVAVAAPIAGALIDRIGVRPVVLAGIVLMTSGYIALAAMNGSLLLFYLLYAATTIVGISTSGLSFTRVISGAFEQTRGTALAISRIGVGLSSAFLPPIAYALMTHFGWRAGYLLMGGIALFIAFPVVWFGTRAISRPAPAALRDGGATAVRWGAILRNPKVIILCLTAGLSFAPAVSLLQQYQPLLVGKGLSAEAASANVGAIGLATLVGAMFSGMLVDRIWAPLIGCLLTLGPVIGCILLLPEQIGVAPALIASALIGLSQGAEIDLVAYMTARYFGLKNYAAIYGASVFMISGMSALYANVIAQLFDHFGNYRLALLICSATFVAAACCYLAMGRYPAAENAPQ